MNKFSDKLTNALKILSERIPEPAPHGDFIDKKAVLDKAWDQLVFMIQKYTQIMKQVDQFAPEVAADLQEKVYEGMQTGALNGEGYDYLVSLLTKTNRFEKFPPLFKPLPTEVPDQWDDPGNQQPPEKGPDFEKGYFDV